MDQQFFAKIYNISKGEETLNNRKCSLKKKLVVSLIGIWKEGVDTTQKKSLLFLYRGLARSYYLICFDKTVFIKSFVMYSRLLIYWDHINNVEDSLVCALSKNNNAHFKHFDFVIVNTVTIHSNSCIIKDFSYSILGVFWLIESVLYLNFLAHIVCG